MGDARDARHARQHGLERRLERRAAEQVLRRRHGLPKVLEALAHEVALLAQLGERGAQLGGGLRVGLDELARLRVGARGTRAFLGQGGRRRHPDHDVAGGRGRRRVGRRRRASGLGPRHRPRGGRGLRVERDARPAEQLQERLLRPLPGRRPFLHVEDRVAAGQVLDRAGEDDAESLEDALAPHRHGRDHLGPPVVERAVERLDLQHLGQVALVVLEDEGHRRRIQVVGDEALRHLPIALDVLLPAVEGGVRDEHERIGALQHQPAGGRVHGLTGNREDLQAQVEAAEAGRPEGEEVEEDRPVLRGVDRDQLPAALRVGAAVQDLQVGGLPPDRRAVVDQLDLDRTVAMIQLDHGGPAVAGDASVPARGARCHGDDGSATGIRTPV